MPGSEKLVRVFRRFVERGKTQQLGSGREYQPCIRAVREEAPSGSKAAQIPSPKLGRAVHVLSTAERAAACLALYHPALFNLHEQRLLSPIPSLHPLDGHPASVRSTKPLPGTLAVAERLGFSDVIAVVELPQKRGRPAVSAPMPWAGDLLLFLDPDDPYVVNWNIKRHSSDFERVANPTPRQRARRAGKLRRDAARIAIEAAYYRDAGIPTIEIALDDIDPYLETNLFRLAAHQCVPATLSAVVHSELVATLRSAIGRAAPFEVFGSLAARFGVAIEDLNTAMLHAIWRRELRVDLLAPILNDRPLRPEKVDVLERYASWFRRS